MSFITGQVGNIYLTMTEILGNGPVNHASDSNKCGEKEHLSDT